MNKKFSGSHVGFVDQLNASVSHRHFLLRDVSRDTPDYWTALMNAFLVVCMLAALAICSWQIQDWRHAQAVEVQPAVANQGFTVSGQHTF